jgi:uncharacterized protein YndB with AHSA1/START domain
MSAQQGGLVLELELILPLAPARVFRLLSDPDELAQWWGPEGFTTPEADLDLRAGGKYRLTMQPPDSAPFHLARQVPRDRPAAPVRERLELHWNGWTESFRKLAGLVNPGA